MKKCVVPLIAITVVVVLVLAGCAAPAEPTTPTTPTTPTEPTEPSGPVYDDPGIPGWGVLEGVMVKPDGTPYKFINACPWLTEPFHVVAQGTLTMLAERAGGEISFYDGMSDTSRHIANLEDVLIENPDGFIAPSADGTSDTPVFDRICDAGIPTISTCQPTASQKVLARVSYDFYEMGAVGGKYLDEYQKANNIDLNIYALHGFAACQAEYDRFQGLYDMTGGNPRITIVESGDTGFASDMAATAVSDAFLTHPDLNAVWGCACVAEGIVAGLKLADRFHLVGEPGHVVVVDMDTFKGQYDCLNRGEIDCLAEHTSWTESDMAFKMLAGYVCLGQPIPVDTVLLDSVPVTMGADYTPRFGMPAIDGAMPLDDWNAWPVLDTRVVGINTPTLKGNAADLPDSFRY
jgi:ABC-type sugar transport system substrate-binding protein